MEDAIFTIKTETVKEIIVNHENDSILVKTNKGSFTTNSLTVNIDCIYGVFSKVDY